MMPSARAAVGADSALWWTTFPEGGFSKLQFCSVGTGGPISRCVRHSASSSHTTQFVEHDAVTWNAWPSILVNASRGSTSIRKLGNRARFRPVPNHRFEVAQRLP